jgi:hypothetical protein
MEEQVPMVSSVKPRDSMTQPFRIVLHKNERNEWVTHCENVIENTGPGGYKAKSPRDLFWGHYFGADYEGAKKDFTERRNKYNI